MIDLTPMINAVIMILAAIAVRYFVPWIKEKTTAQEREDLLVWVDIAVCAAQQLFHHADGETRLEYALSLLDERGFDIDSASVRDAVEAAVLNLHQSLEKEGE